MFKQTFLSTDQSARRAIIRTKLLCLSTLKQKNRTSAVVSQRQMTTTVIMKFNTMQLDCEPWFQVTPSTTAISVTQSVMETSETEDYVQEPSVSESVLGGKKRLRDAKLLSYTSSAQAKRLWRPRRRSLRRVLQPRLNSNLQLHHP
jgi:hypothetical protein